MLMWVMLIFLIVTSNPLMDWEIDFFCLSLMMMMMMTMVVVVLLCEVMELFYCFHLMMMMMTLPYHRINRSQEMKVRSFYQNLLLHKCDDVLHLNS